MANAILEDQAVDYTKPFTAGIQYLVQRGDYSSRRNLEHSAIITSPASSCCAIEVAVAALHDDPQGVWPERIPRRAPEVVQHGELGVSPSAKH